jgi:RNA polymerase sigma factor (sigma-70 family)
MSAEIAGLVDASVRGDRRAFEKIVERYQSAVSGMAYSVTGDLTLSEDLAQETFVIAWRKLGDLQKRESLAPWLCGIARNLARSWMRTHAKNATVSLERVPEPAQPVVASVEEARLREERSETVWTALAQIPETYREPLVLFYRQDHSIRDIAEALELTEDCVKQRLSRGRKMLRAEVTRMVEDTLEESRPGKAFTAGVLAALPPLHAPAPPVAAPAGTTTATALQWLTIHPLTVLCCVGLVVFGGLWGVREMMARHSEDSATPALIASEAPEPRHSAESDAAAVSVAATVDMGAAPAASTAAQGTASVAGVVVFQDTFEPAPAMRVVLGGEDGNRQSTVTDEQGGFGFRDLAAGEYVLLAYDAGFEDVPEDWLRSEHEPVTLDDGAARSDLRIQVPPQGGRIVGRVFERSTGAPLTGFTIQASRADSRIYEDSGDAAGLYSIIGLPEGEWGVHIGNGSPFFASTSTEKMTNVTVTADSNTTFDIPVDLGVSISGHTVDSDSNPAPEAFIDGTLFSDQDHSGRGCDFRARPDGSFTIWGAAPGDRVVLSARKGELASHIAVINPMPAQDVTGVVLTLRPKLSVSGRFVNEKGVPVKAHFWHCPVHPDGEGEWRGQTTAGLTFEESLAPGTYEIKGHAEGVDFGVEQRAQQIEIRDQALSGLTIQVATQSELTGEHTLQGIVVDEAGRPLQATRVYIDGHDDENLNSYHETLTDQQGHFVFEGLIGAGYEVKATATEPYERFAGFRSVNPAETSEVRIVVRKAATLQGQVLDAQTGAPISPFTVEHGVMNYGRERRVEETTIAAGDGAFSVTAPLQEDWYLRVSAEGYAPITETGAALSSGETAGPLLFRLDPSQVVRGVVTDSEGLPVVGARVFFDEKVFEQGLHDRSYAAAESDTDGRFVLTSVPGDAHALYVRKEGFSLWEGAIVENMHIALSLGGIIEGSLYLNGAPLQGASVYAAQFGELAYVYGVTDATGAYSIAALREGGYRLQVVLGHTHPLEPVGLEGEVAVADGMATPRDIALSIGDATLSGRISHNGAPVAGLTLRCSRQGYWSTNSTDEDGRYAFPYLPAGPVTISTCYDRSGPPDTWVWRPILETEVTGGGDSVRDIVLDTLP